MIEILLVGMAVIVVCVLAILVVGWLGDRAGQKVVGRGKEQPLHEGSESRPVERTPAPPATDPAKLDKALNQMFYAGVTFAHNMSQQRREVRRNKNYVARAAGQRCENARLKVRREIGV
jgi:hypothetical protein